MGPSTPAGVAAAVALARLAEATRVAAERARRGEVEGVHDVRTTARRLRAALSTFRDEIAADDREALTERVRHLRDAASPARDLDVVRAALDDAHVVGAGSATLRRRLVAARRSACASLGRALGSPPAAALVDAVRAAAARAAAHAGPPLSVAGAARLPRALERVLAARLAAGSSLATAGVAALHALRIAAKRARYAAELFAPAFGKPVTRLAAALRALQDALGGVQDARTIASVAAREAAAVGDARRRPAARRAARALAAHRAREARASRATLDARFRAALGPRAMRDVFAHLGRRAGTQAHDA